jgi:hypothetical protein
VQLVSASLGVFFGVLLCDLLVGFAFEDAWILELAIVQIR